MCDCATQAEKTNAEIADSMVRDRIERLADKILNATDEAGTKDGMTAAEVVGVLEMCKTEVINKAYEVVS